MSTESKLAEGKAAGQLEERRREDGYVPEEVKRRSGAGDDLRTES